MVGWPIFVYGIWSTQFDHLVFHVTDTAALCYTDAKTPQTCYSLLHLQAWYRYDIIAVWGCWRQHTVQNWRYQTGTVCWLVGQCCISLMQQNDTGMSATDCCSLLEQAVTGKIEQQYWWKLLASDKSELMISVLKQPWWTCCVRAVGNCVDFHARRMRFVATNFREQKPRKITTESISCLTWRNKHTNAQ